MKQNNKLVYLFLSLTVLALVRSIPRLIQPLGTFGYDYGFYLYAIKTAAVFRFPQLFSGAWGGYQNPLFFFSNVLGLPPEPILNASHFLIALLVGWGFYIFFHKKSVSAGVIAVLLVAFSIPQSAAYIMFLWKSSAALIFLLLSVKFLIEKRYRLLAATSLSLLLIHRTTAILYFITLGIYIIYYQIIHRYWKALILELAAVGLMSYLIFPYVSPAITNFLNYPNEYLYKGIFLTGENFFILTWPYLLAAAAGVTIYLRRKEHAFLNIFLVVMILWAVLKLPFYNRVLLYIDVALILYSAYFFAYNNLNPKLKYWLLIAFLSLACWKAVTFNLRQQPLVTTEEVKEIQNFARDNKGSFVVAVSASDAPWLLGYLGTEARLAAPGLFEDHHTYEQWVSFWRGHDQAEFLAQFPQPLYLYQRSFLITSEAEQCFERQGENFYKLICNEKHP